MPSDETGLLDDVLRAGFRLEMLVVSVVLSIATASVVYGVLSPTTSTVVAAASAIAVALAELALFAYVSLKTDV